MILAKCFYVSYSIADFSAEGKSTYHEDAYQDYNNALLVAKELIKCLDIVDEVYVIDGLTGEILNTISKTAPNENDTEENSIPTFTDTFEDGFGGMWYKDADNELWSYNCYGISCHECPYDYDAGCGWCHTTNLSLDDVKKRIAEAKERIGK